MRPLLPPVPLRLALRLAVLAACLLAAPPAHADEAAPPAAVAFVAVNVLPMDSDQVLRDRTVIVEGGRITAIGTDLALPSGAKVIDGHGAAFLLPGLADMHSHADSREDMEVYLANGVTTVLNMGHASAEFVARTRPRLNSGAIPGPHFYVGFMVDGSPEYGEFFVRTPAQARALVGIARANGYDFIKVYNNLSAGCFAALIDEGRKQGMAVIGHGVTRVGLERQIDAGQVMVAHTEEFLYTTFGYPDLGPPDPARIPQAIAFVKRNHAFVTADLNTYATIARQWGRPEVVQAFLDRPEVRYLSPDRRLAWRRSDYAGRSGDIAANLAFLTRFTRQLSDAGVLMITGTDAPGIPGLVPGFSLHDDFDILEAAGLSRYRILVAATRAPGEMISRTIPGAERFGIVTPGARADLLLVESNPFDGMATLRRPLGVMADGRWYARAELEAMLATIAEDYDRAALHH